jgi:oligopeptide/dipeptide ABC transporter ATP-binding protein
MLEVKDLRVRFRTMGALRALMKGKRDPFIDAVLNVSLSIAGGTTLGLVGESGSGKSTLGRAIMGLTKASGGSVTFEGETLIAPGIDRSREIRARSAMMFQDPISSLSPRLRVRSLIAEALKVRNWPAGKIDEEVDRLLSTVGLPASLRSRYPHQLSGGQARRVGVARALALQPKLIIADEPTAGLDVSVQGELLNLLHKVQRETGCALLFITHNLSVAQHFCDQLAIMYLGRIVEIGSAEDVARQARHPYAHGLFSAQPYPDPRRRRHDIQLVGEVPSLAQRPSGCDFHTRCPKAQERCSRDVPLLGQAVPGADVACFYPEPAYPDTAA